MTNLDNVLKNRDIILLTEIHIGKIMGFFFSSHIHMEELDNEEGWVLKDWYFQTVVLEKTLENPLDYKEIKPINPKGNQPWIFISGTDADQELPDIQVGFRKGRGTRDQIANIHWIFKKAREFQKKASTSTSLTTIKPLTVCITANCGRFLKRWEYQTISPASWEICMQVKKQQLGLDMEQQTGSKWERSMSEYIMWNARLDEAQAESRLQGKIPVTPDMQMTPSLWHKVKN